MNNKNLLSIYLELAKVRITMAVTLTTIAGYALANGGFTLKMIPPAIGLWLIACGSAALNQYQERHQDAIMERTKHRPLPSGKISEFHAQVFILIITVAGALIILYSSNFTALILSLLALVWYNLIYTPLKKISAFAVIPGSVIGALPPAVGWVAAGGYLLDPKIIILSFFFFIWQIPHFWLLLMKFGNQYEQAGFPSLTNIYSDAQLKKITFMWTVATSISAMFIPFFNISATIYAKIFISILSVLLIVSFADLFAGKKIFNIKKYFFAINIFLLLVLISIYTDVIITANSY